MLFPNRRYPDIASYATAYFDEMAKASATIDGEALKKAAALISDVIDRRGWIYVCGNGGSAAICNHLFCDFVKGIQTDTEQRPRVMSLSSNHEMISAISNDIGYEETFVYQLRSLAVPGDLLLTISSSGNSENIVRTVQWAKDNGIKTVALTGFEGGRSAKLADVNIHVPGSNYGVIEDLHQSVMHILAQYLRQTRMQPTKLGYCKF